MSNEEKKTVTFVKGMFFQKRAKSPDFVIGSLSIKVPELVPFLEQNQNNAGYVNIDVLKSRKMGNPYCALNTWERKKPEAEKVEQLEPVDYPTDELKSDEIPF